MLVAVADIEVIAPGAGTGPGSSFPTDAITARATSMVDTKHIVCVKLIVLDARAKKIYSAYKILALSLMFFYEFYTLGYFAVHKTKLLYRSVPLGLHQCSVPKHILFTVQKKIQTTSTLRATSYLVYQIMPPRHQSSVPKNIGSIRLYRLGYINVEYQNIWSL